MTSSGDGGRAGGLVGALTQNPAVDELRGAAKNYVRALGGQAVQKVGERLSGVTNSLTNTAESGGFKATAATTAVRKVVEGKSPVRAALSGVGHGIKESISGLFRKKSGGSGNKKFMNIMEDIKVGVPVNVAYDQWTQYQEFSTFMKGVDSVDQTDEVNSNWRVKVFKSRRNWKATVTEAIPDRKIAWTTDGAKGTTKGVVTFHPLADDLTQVLVVMEYFPQGFFEKTGNIWRAPGRRARLDLKNYRRFLMERGEATGSWRGEIRDGQVVRQPDEEGQEEERRPQEREAAERQAGDGRVEAAGEAEGQEPEEAEEEAEEESEEAEEPEEPEEEHEEERPRRPRRRQPASARRAGDERR
jgi:uncharacterized membrane protein